MRRYLQTIWTVVRTRAVLMTGSLLAVVQAMLGQPHPEDHFPELRMLLEYAEENSPLAEIQDMRLEETEGALIAARSANKPRINLTARVFGSLEHRSDLSTLETHGMAAASITARQPLYYWGAVSATRRIGELGYELVETEVAEARGRMVAEIRAEYLQLVIARKSVAILEETVAASRELITVQEDSVNGPRLPESEMLHWRNAHYDYEEQLGNARLSVRRLEEQLALKTGYYDVRRLGHIPFPAIRALDAAALDELRMAIDHMAWTPLSIRRDELAVETEEERFKTIRSRRRPLIDLVAGISQDQIETVGQADYEYRVLFFTGIQVNWNIFDGSETRGREIESVARQRLLELRLEHARTQHRQHLIGLYEVLEHNLRQMVARDERVDLAERQLALREDMAAREQLPRADLLRDRLQTNDARRRALEVRAEYLRNLSAFNVALYGDPLIDQPL